MSYSSQTLGHDITEMVATPSTAKGTRATFNFVDSTGQTRSCEAVYVQFTDASSAVKGTPVRITPSYTAAATTTTSAATNLTAVNDSFMAGFVAVATTQNSYGWALVKGEIEANCAAIAAFKRIFLTSGATVDDTVTAYQVRGAFAPAAISAGTAIIRAFHDVYVQRIS